MVEDQDLTAREAELIELMAQGYSNKEIADRLFLSPHTVKTHLRRAFRKWGVRNRVEAATWWARRGDRAMAAAPSEAPPAKRSPWSQVRLRLLTSGAGAIAVAAAVALGALFFPGLGLLQRDTASSAPAVGCQTGDSFVIVWPTLEEQPLTLPDGTATSSSVLGNGRAILLSGYSSTAEVLETSDGSALYACPARYDLDAADLEAHTGP